MELLLIRTDQNEKRTFGELAIGAGALRFCYTLELPKPIPAGTYKVKLTVSGRATRGELWSPRKDFTLPELVNVPGHEGIRVHAGNTVKDTKLCILVGFDRVVALDSLVQSRTALEALMNKITDPCFITITEA